MFLKRRGKYFHKNIGLSDAVIIRIPSHTDEWWAGWSGVGVFYVGCDRDETHFIVLKPNNSPWDD